MSCVVRLCIDRSVRHGDKGKCKNRSQLHIRTNNETIFFSFVRCSLFLRMKTSCYHWHHHQHQRHSATASNYFCRCCCCFCCFWLMFLHSLTFIANRKKSEREKGEKRWESISIVKCKQPHLVFIGAQLWDESHEVEKVEDDEEEEEKSASKTSHNLDKDGEKTKPDMKETTQTHTCSASLTINNE